MTVGLYLIAYIILQGNASGLTRDSTALLRCRTTGLKIGCRSVSPRLMVTSYGDSTRRFGFILSFGALRASYAACPVHPVPTWGRIWCSQKQSPPAGETGG